MNDDDALRAGLAAADPARALRALDDERITRMTEQAIDRAERPGTEEASAARRPRRAVWLGIGGGVLVAAAAATAAVLAMAPGGVTTRLVDGGSDAAAMCMAVTPDTLARNANAFKGTVTSISGDEVTLRVDEVYRGEVGSTVVLRQDAPTAVDFSATQYEPGTAYLVSFNEGYVAYCGQSGADSPELEALYEAAYR